MRTKTGWFRPAIHWRQIQTGSFFGKVLRKSAQQLGNASNPYESLPSNWGTLRTPTKARPAAGERFEPLRKLAQPLGNASNPYESLPSCWGTIRIPTKACPAAGERFAPLRKLAQLLGSDSHSAKACPAAGERFALRESLPSNWGANRAPCEIQLSHWMKKLIYDDNNRIIRF